jgi:hypothetical protein
MAAQWNDRARLDAMRLSTFHLRMAKKCTEVYRVGVSYSSRDYFMRISSAQLFLLLLFLRFFFYVLIYAMIYIASLSISLSLFSCIFSFFLFFFVRFAFFSSLFHDIKMALVVSCVLRPPLLRHYK